MSNMAEKIKIVLIKRNMTVADLADKLGTSRTNFYNKMTRNDFRTSDLEEIAAALDCTYKSGFELNDTNEYV